MVVVTVPSSPDVHGRLVFDRLEVLLWKFSRAIQQSLGKAATLLNHVKG